MQLASYYYENCKQLALTQPLVYKAQPPNIRKASLFFPYRCVANAWNPGWHQLLKYVAEIYVTKKYMQAVQD